MKADRMLSILFALQQGATLTVRELAQRLEVSPRTVTRDLEALAAAGVPVYAERGYGGGWRLTEGFRARFNGLKQDDVERLFLSQSGAERLFVQLGREREFRETWDRLLQAASAGNSRSAGDGNGNRNGDGNGVISSRVRERIHIDGAGWRESFEALPHLPALYDAVWQSRVLRMQYGHPAAGAASAASAANSASTASEAERELLPYGLVAKGGTWYVVGSTEGALRTYRVSRIATLRETGDTFKRPSDFDLEAYWSASVRTFRERLPSYTVHLLLSKSAYERLKLMRYVHVEQTRSAEDSIAATLNLETREYAVECLLRLGGEGVCLLEPPELREAMKAAICRLAAAYH